MPYDALGNYVPGDEPSIDQMQYELTKRGRRVDDPRRLDKPTSLDSAVDTIKNVAKQTVGTAIKHGLQARDALGDVGRLGVQFSPLGVIPLWQAVGEAGLSNVNKLGAEGLYRLTGDEENAARVAKERANLPSIDKLTEKYSAPLQMRTPGGQAIQQGVTNFLFDDLKLPPIPIGPRGSGFAASGERRPLLTPNDTRAMMGEASRVATQVRDIPTDFQNAQSGFTRLDPITNKPTFGAKLQGAAESVGDTIERRRAQGLNAVPGVPDVLMPETSMYAVRPSGGAYMVNPKLPETATVRPPDLDAGAYTIINELKPVPVETPENVQELYIDKVLTSTADTGRAYNEYWERKLREMFPETTSKREAFQAFENTYTTEQDRARKGSEIIEGFVSEYNQANPDAKIVTPSEYKERLDAANKWLEGPFYKQMYKNVGTTLDPLVKLAEQGYTLEEADKLIADWSKPDSSTKRYRELAGFNPMGEYYEPLQQVTQQIAAKEQEYLPLEQRRMELQNIAADQGLQDPAQIPEYAAITTPRNRLAAEIAKLKEKQSNLQLANAFENASDSMVNTVTAAEAYENIPRAQRHFFPQLRDLASSAPDTKVYDISSRQAGRVGYYEMANEYVDKIMKGEIPVSKIHKTPLDVFVKNLSKERQDKAKAAQLAIEQRINDVQTKLKEDLALAPKELRFGKSTALEVSNRFSPEEVRRILSADTEVLDHCISQCGSPEHGARNIFQPQDKSPRTYLPIADPITGVKARPDVQDTSYIRNILSGNQFHTSMRDNQTGLPFITIQFSDAGYSPTGQPLYDMGFASGYQNKGADPKYKDDIAAYLNSRSNIIRTSNAEKLQEAGVYDTKNLRQAFYSDINTSKKEFDKAFQNYEGTIPRFLTAEQGRKIIEQARAASTALAPANGNTPEVQQMFDQRARLIEERADLERQGLFGDRLDDVNSQLDDIDQRLGRLRASMAERPAGNIYNYGDAYQLALDHDDRRAPLQFMARTLIDEAFRNVASTIPGAAAYVASAPELQMTMLSREQLDAVIENLTMSASVVDTFDADELADEGLTPIQQEYTVDQLSDAITRLQSLLPARQAQAAPLAPAIEAEANTQIRTIVDTTLRRQNDPEVDQQLVAVANHLNALAADRAREGQSPFGIADFIRDELNRHRNYVLNGAFDPDIYVPRMTAQQTNDYVGALRSAIDSIGNFLVVNRPRQELAPAPAPVPFVTPQQAEPLVNAYVNAFTEQTGNRAVDDFLTRIEDTLDESVNDQVDAGDRRLNDIAISIANTIANIQNRIANEPNYAMDTYNLSAADARVAARRLEDALASVLDVINPRADDEARAVEIGTLQADLTTISEDAINRDDQAGFMVQEAIESHFDREHNDLGDMLNDIIFDITGRIDYLRELDEQGLEEYGIENIDALEQTTIPEMVRAANRIRAIMDRMPDAPAGRRMIEPQQPQLPAPVIREPAQQQAQLPEIQAFVNLQSREVGAQTGERIETVLYRISENVNGLHANPRQFMRQVRDAAEIEQNALVERGLNEFADLIEDAINQNQLEAPPAEVAVPPALQMPVAERGIPDAIMPNEQFEQAVEDLFTDAENDIGGDAEYILDHYFRDDHGPQIMRIDALLEAIDDVVATVNPEQGGDVPERFDGEDDPDYQRYLVAFDRLSRRLSDLQTDLQDHRMEQLAQVSYNILQQNLNNAEREQVNEYVNRIQLVMDQRGENPNDYIDSIRRGTFGGNELPRVNRLTDIQRELLVRDLVDAYNVRNLPELNFEPDNQHPANMLDEYTFQDVQNMARELFEAERIDGGRVDIRSIEDSIHALNEYMFDDERLRRYEPATRDRFSRQLAEELQILLDQDRAVRGYAKGGRVQQIPSTDQMQYELMMRRA